MDSLHLFLLDQGIPVEYELDTFNTPHTGTTLRHPQNWLCHLRCRISLRHLALISPLGHIFTRPHVSPQNNQKHKITVILKFISSNGKHPFRYILQKYFHRTSNNTRCYLNFHLFTSFLFLEACSTNANSIFPAARKKNYHKNISYILNHLLYIPYKLSEETTQRKHTHVTTFPR